MLSQSSLGCWLLLVGILIVNSAHAVTISPVMIELSNAKRVVSVTISNPSDQPINFQAETLSWRQSDGNDHYEPTDELVVAPPIAQIPPKSKQIFRVAMRVPNLNNDERAYRLILEDVSEVSATQLGVVNIRFRHNLPVFVVPADEEKISLRWSKCSAPAGQGCVRLDNEGNRRIRFLELVVAGDGWQKTISGGTVLSKSWKSWQFDLPGGQSQPVSIKAKTVNHGAISANLSD